MKVVIPLVVLSSLFLVSVATAGDAKEMIRENLAFCNQFAIHDPDPGVVFDHMLSRARNVRDCPVYIWGAIRWVDPL